ncbi:MAG: aquaporin [Panacagrimonas sp.]
MGLGARLLSEFSGTAFLLVAVVGSGIMGEQLAQGNAAIALLANSLATAGVLIALILVCGPVSGAHFNPVVTLALAARGDLPWRDVAAYMGVQVAGAIGGVWLAHAMFELPILQASDHVRAGPAQLLSEFIATLGLLCVVLRVSRSRPDATPYAVAAYILAAYWFTASTSFANPAVTLARALTDSFAGIRPADVPGFLIAQSAATAAVVTLGFRLRAPVGAPS